MSTSISLEIPVAWRYVRQVRDLANHLLIEHPEALRTACAMVASELVENAIKYGEIVETAQCARFSMVVAADGIRIEVSNGVQMPELAQTLIDTIDRINHAADCEELYVSRMQSLLEDPSKNGQMGLYKICCEGGFQISYMYDGRVITVKAFRGLS